MKRYFFIIAALFACFNAFAQSGSLIVSGTTEKAEGVNSTDVFIGTAENAIFFTEDTYILYDSEEMTISAITIADSTLRVACPGIGMGYVKKIPEKASKWKKPAKDDMTPPDEDSDVYSERDLGEKDIEGLPCTGKEFSVNQFGAFIDLIIWETEEKIISEAIADALDKLAMVQPFAEAVEISVEMDLTPPEGKHVAVKTFTNVLHYSAEQPDAQMFVLPEVNYVEKKDFDKEYRKYKRTFMKERRDNPGQTYKWNSML